MKTRIMYIENKSVDIADRRIGKVSFSKTSRTMFYIDKEFIKIKGGYKHNCIEAQSGDKYWISGCKKNGQDTLYQSNVPVPIDENARIKYWALIRHRAELINNNTTNYQE